MRNINVSNNVIRRMPRYLRMLDELMEMGITRTSSAKLSELMGLTASQIRQDFSCFGEFGLQGYGYEVRTLRENIAEILGMNRNLSAILVGAGNIGRALAENFSFAECGIELKCAFDADFHKVGKSMNGVSIKAYEELEEYLNENKVDIAVLCVPQKEAVSVAEHLIDNGIEAFWNFTNAEIVGPRSNILVENIHFSDSLMALSYFMSNNTVVEKIAI